jgi:LysM repeat protein
LGLDETQLAETTTAAENARTEVVRLTRTAEESETNLQALQATLLERANNDTASTSRISQLEAEVQRLQSARPAAPAYPDLTGRVRELETELTALRRAPRAPAYPDLSDRVADLERQLAAARNTAPAYPDLSGRVAELETQLARAANTPSAPAYPDLSGRVEELQAALADTQRQLTLAQTELSAGNSATTDTSALDARLAETEDKLATALRGYSLLEKDRDALQARATEAQQAVLSEKESLAAQVATLNGEIAQLRAASADRSQVAATAETLASERDALAARLSQVESAAATAQAETARLAESLAALQRSTGQTTTEAANARALVQQLQGANAVLAQENYQLKTMLARNPGAPAPVVASASSPAPTVVVPVPPPGARIHVVASGDSLSRISQRYYGTAGRWQEIYTANAEKLGPNGVLRIGTELRIP